MQGPSNEPPPQYAAYPRASASVYGSADKLRALAKGYFGLNSVFLVNFLMALASQLLLPLAGPSMFWTAFCGYVVLVGLIVGFATYPFNKKIGYGANWSSGMPVVASTLMALNSAFCCGIVGYVVVQHLAAREMKKYGVRMAVFGGIKKKEIERIAADMEMRERTPASFTVPTESFQSSDRPEA
jgi:hypothetical protein